MVAALSTIGGFAAPHGELPASSESSAPESREAVEASDKDAPPSQRAKAPVRPADPPPAPSLEDARGPDVTLIAGEERTVYEYRQNGKLRLIKVVPDVGKPYFLAPRDPTTGFGDLEQADTLVPRWVLIEF